MPLSCQKKCQTFLAVYSQEKASISFCLFTKICIHFKHVQLSGFQVHGKIAKEECWLEGRLTESSDGWTGRRRKWTQCSRCCKSRQPVSQGTLLLPQKVSVRQCGPGLILRVVTMSFFKENKSRTLLTKLRRIRYVLEFSSKIFGNRSCWLTRVLTTVNKMKLGSLQFQIN